MSYILDSLNVINTLLDAVGISSDTSAREENTSNPNSINETEIKEGNVDTFNKTAVDSKTNEQLEKARVHNELQEISEAIDKKCKANGIDRTHFEELLNEFINTNQKEMENLSDIERIEILKKEEEALNKVILLKKSVDESKKQGRDVPEGTDELKVVFTIFKHSKEQIDKGTYSDIGEYMEDIQCLLKAYYETEDIEDPKERYDAIMKIRQELLDEKRSGVAGFLRKAFAKINDSFAAKCKAQDGAALEFLGMLGVIDSQDAQEALNFSLVFKITTGKLSIAPYVENDSVDTYFSVQKKPQQAADDITLEKFTKSREYISKVYNGNPDVELKFTSDVETTVSYKSAEGIQRFHQSIVDAGESLNSSFRNCMFKGVGSGVTKNHYMTEEQKLRFITDKFIPDVKKCSNADEILADVKQRVEVYAKEHPEDTCAVQAIKHIETAQKEIAYSNQAEENSQSASRSNTQEVKTEQSSEKTNTEVKTTSQSEPSEQSVTQPQSIKAQKTEPKNQQQYSTQYSTNPVTKNNNQEKNVSSPQETDNTKSGKKTQTVTTKQGLARLLMENPQEAYEQLKNGDISPELVIKTALQDPKKHKPIFDGVINYLKSVSNAYLGYIVNSSPDSTVLLLAKELGRDRIEKVLNRDLCYTVENAFDTIG